MIPAEVIRLQAGYAWREDREWERLAWLASHLLAAAGAKVTPAQLLGKDKPKTTKILTREQAQTVVDEVKAQIKWQLEKKSQSG